MRNPLLSALILAGFGACTEDGGYPAEASGASGACRHFFEQTAAAVIRQVGGAAVYRESGDVLVESPYELVGGDTVYVNCRLQLENGQWYLVHMEM